MTVNSGTVSRLSGERYWDAVIEGFGKYSQVTVASSLSGTSSSVDIWTLMRPQTESLGYDNDGNLTTDALYSYTYDAENRLIRVMRRSETDLAAAGWSLARPPTWELVFRYDYRGRRIEKTVKADNVVTYSRRYIHSGWNLIAEIEVTGTTAMVKRSYGWGLDVYGSLEQTGGAGALLFQVVHETNALTPYSMLSDGQGNVVGVVNSAGTAVAIYEYDPYGQLLRAEGTYAKENPFRYSTKFHDEHTGLVYYGYRFYNPSLGRFINRDPIGDEGGANLYAFVTNEPIANHDRLGLETNTAPPERMPEFRVTPTDFDREQDERFAQALKDGAELFGRTMQLDNLGREEWRSSESGGPLLAGAQVAVDSWWDERQPTQFKDLSPTMRMIRLTNILRDARAVGNRQLARQAARALQAEIGGTREATFGQIVAGILMGFGASGAQLRTVLSAGRSGLSRWHEAMNSRYTWGSPPGGHWSQGVSHQLRSRWGLVGTNAELHHWAIPQGGWGRAIPNYIKNQAWNIKIAESRAAHAMIDTAFSVKGVSPYPVLVRPLLAMPNWARVATLSTGVGAGYGISEGLGDE